MILVYANKLTNRLRYIFELYFEELLQVPLSFTDQLELFRQHDGIKLNYSDEKLEGVELQMKPHPLLFEADIRFQNLRAVECNQQLCLFPTSGNSFLPFDLFAAGFFLVSRYEEYLERQFGKHGRYPAHHSILYRNKVLGKPVVNQWARQLAAAIKKVYPEFKGAPPAFDFKMTIDVDNAWAFRNKSVGRMLGASVGDVVRGRTANLKRRWAVWSAKEADPYDTYDYIRSCYVGNESLLQFFFLIGKSSRFDRNLPASSGALQELIRNLSQQFKVGLHPSYRSNHRKRELVKERKALETILGTKVTVSRQHYLKLIFPTTYRRLLHAGIREDHTLGYAETVGFRAGIAAPFWFYDLEGDLKTNLRVYPFQSMEVTLRDYMQKSPAEAIELLREMMLEVKESGGTFICLWHNESLSDEGRWKGWRQVFEEVTALGISLKHE